MSEAGRSRWVLASTWGCIVAGILMLAVLSQRVERTPDEANYQMTGRALLAREPMQLLEQRFQGPLILLGTQLTDGGEPVRTDAALRQARLGMLVFPALLLVVLAMWTRKALGERAGLLAAFLAATNPALLAYGPLLSSDVAFTAMALLAGWLAWRWLQAPGLWSLVALSAALGAVAATKYTALLTCAAVALTLGVAIVFGGFDPWPRRAGGVTALPGRLAKGVLAAALAAAIALGVLYAAYLFTSPPLPTATAQSLQSPLLRALAALPGGAWLLGLLPESFVLGVDYQALVAGATANGTFLDQQGNHVAYYPVTVLFKTPLVVFGAIALAAVARGAERAPRGLWPCALVPPFALLAYCSATLSLQMGMRYVLPVVPALVMLACAFAGRPWVRTRSGLCAIAVVVAGSLWNVVWHWPHFIGFFNTVAGGCDSGFRVVADGNCDWQQLREPGRSVLRERHPDIVCLEPGQGPRFGKVASYADSLKAIDARDTSRTYHWLTRFSPFDHVGAAWLAFDVQPAAFKNAIAAGDHRAAEDFAIAWLMAGELAPAERVLELVRPDGRDDAWSRTRDLVRLVAAAGSDPGRRDIAAGQLAAAGHFELALQLIDRTNRANAVRVFWLLSTTGSQREAVDFLEAAGADGSRTIEEIVLLVGSLTNGGYGYVPQPMRALELMQRGPAPEPGSPAYEGWQQIEVHVRAAIDRDRQKARVR